MEAYMAEFFPRTWAKFDMNNTGEIDITESHTFFRSLLGRLNQFVLAPGSLTDISVWGINKEKEVVVWVVSCHQGTMNSNYYLRTLTNCWVIDRLSFKLLFIYSTFHFYILAYQRPFLIAQRCLRIIFIKSQYKL